VALRAAKTRCAAQLPRLRIPRVARLRERDRRDPLARREVREQATLLLIVARELDRETRERVTEDRARQCARAELLHHQRELEQAESGAAERLGHGEPGDAHLGEALPERGIVTGAGVEDLAQARRRALARDEAAHRLLEQELLLGQAEMHGGE
jgi:hypothetical protein